MGIVIFIVVALLLGLMISGKRTSDKRRDHLIKTLQRMDENSVRIIGMRSLYLHSSTSKEQIISFIKKNWNYFKNKEKEFLILDVMIVDANLSEDELKANRLLNEKLKLAGIREQKVVQERSQNIYDILDKFENGLRTLALKTIRENYENPMIGTITLNSMGNFRKAFENKVMSKKRELDFDEEEIQNAIENIYTKIYEEVFEIK